MSRVQTQWAGMQSPRADKALAVDTLWASLSLYINHCASQAGAAQPSAPAAAPADAASEPMSTASQQDPLPVEQTAPATIKEAAPVSLSGNAKSDIHCLSNELT